MKIYSIDKGWPLRYLYILGMCLCCSAALANTPKSLSLFQQQPEQVSGTITDSRGGLPGVTINVKGKSTLSITDHNGRYTIQAMPTDSLVYSFVGYKTITVPVNGRTVIDTVLEEDATSLQEVTVNAGYYKVKDKERTGSISKITAADIENQPVTNVLATMQGRMAGVNIVQESGISGGGFNINIRGLNSLREGANAPLYIIDGVPYSSDPISDRQTSSSIPGDGNPLSSINPGDVESLEVLKDADATAIYGSRGANGVVLITTKRGKIGKTSFSFNASHGAGEVTRFMDLMNTEQYLDMRRQAFANDGITTYPANAYDINGTWDQERYTDWQQVLTGGTATINSVQTTVSGGSESTQYLLSGTYREESSVFPGNFLYKRTGTRASFDHNSTDKKFRISFSGSYTSQDNDLPWMDFVTLSRQLAPNAPELYNENGELNWENRSWTNPLSNLESKSLAKTSDLIGNSMLSYNVATNLVLKTSIGITDLRNDDSRSIPSTMYNPVLNLGSQNSSIYRNSFRRKSWIIEPQLHWSYEAGNSQVDVLAGATFQDQSSDRLTTRASNFSSNSLLYNMAAATTIQVFNNDHINYRYQAFFGRANYTYAGKYIINLTGRRDGSSRFGPDTRFATFGAVGAAWLFSRESVFEDNLKFLSFGKVRLSYGTTGNDQIGDYQFMDTYGSSGYLYGTVAGLQPSRLLNTNFGWESNTKFEAALETGFFQDRVFFTAAWYRNRSSNQLVGLPLPGTTGFTSIQANLDATVQNTGFEATLRTVNLKAKGFEWVTSVNLTMASNKLVSFPDLEASSYKNDYVIGEPTTIRKLFHFTGVDPETGIYQFKDINGDGVITYADDRETIKDFNPKYFGGLHNLITYKQIKLDFLFQFVKQQNFNFANTQRFPGLLSNQPVQYTDRWQQAGDVAPYQLYTTGINQAAMKAGEYFAQSDAAVGDASYIRLKNISISYDVPKAWLAGTECRLSLQAQNLLTITSFKGADPEFTQGGTLPPLKIVSAGIQLNF